MNDVASDGLAACQILVTCRISGEGRILRAKGVLGGGVQNSIFTRTGEGHISHLKMI